MCVDESIAWEEPPPHDHDIRTQQRTITVNLYRGMKKPLAIPRNWAPKSGDASDLLRPQIESARIKHGTRIYLSYTAAVILELTI